jgi:hypothetical protein
VLDDRSEIARGITARHLQVPIADALSFGPDDLADAAWLSLDTYHFDNAPVLLDGRVVGVVSKDRLRGEGVQTVREALVQVGSDFLVSADATVAQLLGWLAASQLLFVLDGHDITGFVTPGDLNKQPGRTYFFLLLAEVEINLAEIVRRLFRGAPSRQLELLGSRRRKKVLERFTLAEAADREPDYVAYFNLADLLSVVRRSADAHVLLGVPSASAWDRATRSFVDLRNAVVHGVRDLVDAKRGPSELQTIDARLREAVSLTAVGLQRLGLRHLVLVTENEQAPELIRVALAGVDGCRAGWIAAIQDRSGLVRLELIKTTAELLKLDVALVAIDMPIGLRDFGSGAPGRSRRAGAARSATELGLLGTLP